MNFGVTLGLRLGEGANKGSQNVNFGVIWDRRFSDRGGFAGRRELLRRGGFR